MNIIISETIKAERKRLGLSQEVLGEKFGVSTQAVSKWESAQACPDISLLPIIADFFGVTVDYLLTGRIPSPREETDKNDEISTKCPNTNTLYIVEIFNGEILSAFENFGSDRINLELPAEKFDSL